MRKEYGDADPNSQIIDFLEQSNNIENVWDKESLNQALEAWKFIINEDFLSTETILHTHQILIRGKLGHQDLGAFRKHSVRIGGRDGQPWSLVPELIGGWATLVNGTIIESLADEGLIRQQHVAFEIIHPFADGNGRMGRILMNWTRTKAGLPILIIKEIEKHQYYQWFLD